MPATVFVCGTYADISAERGTVLVAIQKLQLRHNSMEFFGARPEKPIDTCLEEVAQSDILVVIVGDKYGTIVPGMTISFSEAEYQEARRLDKPCLVYVKKQGVAPPSDQDLKPEKAQLLEKWKSSLRAGQTVWEFPDGNDLAIQVAVDLSRWLNSRGDGGSVDKPKRQRTVSIVSRTRVETIYSQRFGDQARQLLHGLATDSSGNIIAVGDFWGTINFGGDNLTSVKDRDIFLAKFDATGKHLWSKSFGDDKQQVGVGVDVDAAGAVFVASAFKGVLSFGSKQLVSSGTYNFALVKLAPTGQYIWGRAFGDNSYHVPENIAVAPTGDVIVSGRFQGTLALDDYTLTSSSEQSDIFLAVFSSEGKVRWAKQIGGPFEQQTRSLAIGADGAIALTGVFKCTLRIGNQVFSQEKPNDYCGFLAKFNLYGDLLWCNRFGEPYVEQGSVVKFDKNTGDLLVAGFIRNRVSGGRSLCLFARYDPEGILRWSKLFGPYVLAESIAVNKDGQILLTGYFQGSTDLGLGPLASTGGYDMFAATFNPDGALLWSERFGDRWHQFLIRGTYGRDDTIVLGGSFHGTVDFGAGLLTAVGYDGKQEGTEDVFLAILKQQS